MGGGKTPSCIQSGGLLGRALWHLRELGSDHVGGDFWYGSAFADHRIGQKRPPLAGECRNYRFHECWGNHSCLLAPRALGFATPAAFVKAVFERRNACQRVTGSFVSISPIRINTKSMLP